MAQRAFLDKLPRNLRALALDMACIKEDNLSEFEQALGTLYKNFQIQDINDNTEKVRRHLQGDNNPYVFCTRH